VNTLSERARLSLLCFLLLLVLGFLAFSAVNTIQAARSFQQQYSAVKTGDVKAIRPWMTIHAVSHIYHVPEDYLYRSLNIGNPLSLRHLTLYDIAKRKHQSVDQIIRSIQHAILAYRKTPPHYLTPTPTPTQHTHMKPAPAPGRTKY
jgi:hypothetical protein